MRIKVTLECPLGVRIPVNHQDALGAIAYGLLGVSDREYSSFLHDEGYMAGKGERRVKLFCFSWLRLEKKRLHGEWLEAGGGTADWLIGSPVAPFLQHFATGLLQVGQMRIGDARLPVTTVQTLAAPDYSAGRLKCRCLSPIVASVHRPAEEGPHARYLRPADGEEFSAAMHANLAYKYRVIHGRDPEGEAVRVEFDQAYLASHRGGTKLMSSHGLQIVGALAPFTVTGEPDLIETGYDCGFGEKNSAGFGMVEVME